MTGGRPMQFSLMFFASSEEALGDDKYRLLVESARFGDRRGFARIWVPERHFTTFGCIYPNPAVLHAALARETRRIGLCAGSVVLPLHDSIRVAEEWAVVDNLSDGRVGVAFASGWNPDDFAFFPERYDGRREATFSAVETVKKLWRGDAIATTSGNGRAVNVRIYPAPVQRELPIWITAAGNPATFVRAGAIGAHLLTHLLDQGIDALAEKVGLYREARRAAGHDPASGQVTVMVHTFVGEDIHDVRSKARHPYCEYLKANASLLAGLAWSRGREVDLSSLSAKDLDDLVGFLYDRFAEERGLIGTPRSCLPLLGALDRAGIDEVACLLDFGPPVDLILRSLPHLDALKDLYQAQAADDSSTTVSARLPELVEPGDARSSVSLEEIQARCGDETPGAEFYRRLAEREVDLRGSFRGIRRLWRRDGEALGWVQLDNGDESSHHFRVHPGLLDACNQVLAAALPEEAVSRDGETLYLPVGLATLRLHAALGEQAWSHATLRPQVDAGGRSFEGDVRILDATGRLQAEIAGLRIRATPPGLLRVRDTERMRDCLYDSQWELQPPTSDSRAPGELQRRWVIFADAGGIGERLAESIEARGEAAAIVTAGESFTVVDDRRFVLARDSVEDLDSLIGVLRTAGSPESLCLVHLWSLDVPPVETTSAASLESDQALGSVSVFRALQALMRAAGLPPVKLWLVTRGAQPVGEEPAALEVAQSPVWALGRVLRVEHPEMWGGLVDLDPGAAPEVAAGDLLNALTGGDREDQVAFRQRQRFVTRFGRARWVPAERDLPVVGHHSYLITGGLGDLGLRVAAWLVEKGARHLMLASRAALPPRATWGDVDPDGPLGRRIAAIAELEGRGAVVRLGPVDVSDEAQLTAFIEAAAGAGWPPIRGVVHAAAALAGRLLSKMDAASWNDAMRAKARGAWLLHRRFEHTPLDFFVLFSAIPALVGPTGLGAANYAAANAFLDALSHHRRRRGRHALSVNWGPWSEIGMAARRPGGLAALAEQGLNGMAPSRAIEALEYALRRNITQVAVAAFDWPRFFGAFPAAASYPDLSRLAGERSPGAVEGRDGMRDGALLSATAERRHDLLLAYVTDVVGAALGLESSAVDQQGSLESMGLDSLMAIELKTRLAADYGLDISVVKFLDGISIAQLAGRLAQHVEADARWSPAPSATAPPVPAADESPSRSTEEAIDADRARELLVDLDSLSDSEVARLLRITATEA